MRKLSELKTTSNETGSVDFLEAKVRSIKIKHRHYLTNAIPILAVVEVVVRGGINDLRAAT